jgi:hypothetical protein
MTKLQTSRKSVQFKDCEVYEFPVTLGDHPAVTCGCPLTMEPKAQTRYLLPLDIFEKNRPARKSHKNLLRITSRRRTHLLLRHGHGIGEIAQAALIAMQIKKQRRETLSGCKRQRLDKPNEAIDFTGGAHQTNKRVLRSIQVGLTAVAS